MTDPIGQAIYNFHYYNDPEVLRVDTNYTIGELLDPAWFFRKIERMPAVEAEALRMCRGKILDIGAGAGCHTLELQKRGMDVTALEISELSSDVMRARGVSKIVTEDVFTWSGSTFDTILLLMNGAGIGGTIEGMKMLLEKLRLLLNPDGQILMDSTNIDYLFTEDDGSFWIDLANKNYRGEMRYKVTYKENIITNFLWLFIDFDKLAEVAGLTGFNAECVLKGPADDYLAKLILK